MKKHIKKILRKLGIEIRRTNFSYTTQKSILGYAEDSNTNSDKKDVIKYSVLTENKFQSKYCVVYLVFGDELLAIFENSLLTLRYCGVTLDVVVYYGGNQYKEIELIAKKYQISVKILGDKDGDKSVKYSQIGTIGFNEATAYKWSIIIDAIESKYDGVIYTDCDIVFLGRFDKYIQKISKLYEGALQTESQNAFPPIYCTGFMYFSKESKEFLSHLYQYNLKNLHIGNDQDIFNEYVLINPELVRELWSLPESQFQNGLFWKTHIEVDDDMNMGELKPYMYHANFIKGIEKKIVMLKKLKLWKLEKN